MRIGVLALQGAFDVHAERLRSLDADVVGVRRPDHLVGVDALVLPGGESTAMSNLLRSSGLEREVRTAIDGGLPVFGTCAGMILLSESIADGRPDQISFAAMPITVRRNAYGRQVDSFETDLDIDGLDEPFHAIFIRAPRILDFDPSVEVLARHQGAPVLVRKGSCLAASFHPELTDDSRIHALFIRLVSDSTIHAR